MGNKSAFKDILPGISKHQFTKSFHLMTNL